MTVLLTLIKKVKLIYLLIIALLVMITTTGVLQDRLRKAESERDRHQHNYEQLVEEDSTKVAELILKRNEELAHYLRANKELLTLIQNQNIKIKNIETIIHQKHVYIDTITRSYDITELKNLVLNQRSGVVPFKDSTKCLVLEGHVKFDGDSIKVAVDNRIYDSTISIISHWKKNPKNFFTRLFGRKRLEVTATSSCGDTKTVLIKRS